MFMFQIYINFVVVGEYSILLQPDGDSRSIPKTAPGILEDRTQGSDQWEAEARTADAVREHDAGILS